MGGWGRDRKEPHVYDNETRFEIPYKPPTDLMEACVPIVDINECRNNYLVSNAHKKVNINSLVDFKKKVGFQIDWVYDGINICAGSNSKDSCTVRFIVYLRCFFLISFLRYLKILFLAEELMLLNIVFSFVNFSWVNSLFF